MSVLLTLTGILTKMKKTILIQTHILIRTYVFVPVYMCVYVYMICRNKRRQRIRK